MEEWDTGGTAHLLKYIQERSDDIEKVMIPQHPFVIERGTGRRVEAGLIIHLVGGEKKIIPNQQDAEAVLTDGILHRMKIKIELGR